MDASSHAARPVEPVVDIDRIAARRDTVRTLAVTAIYHLSEEGRKASLVDGGDGRAVQQVTLTVPTHRFHLVSVDADGAASLRLQPRYFLDADQDVRRSDGPPVYDAPPSAEDLLRDAARNHQLERAFNVEQAEKKSKRRDEQFEVHEKLAEQFLGDPAMRALPHPKPTPRQCYLQRGRRQVLFDAKIGNGLARQVPPEAFRRFAADLKDRRERNLSRRAAQLELHAQRQRAISDWVERRGTADQKARHAAGVLALAEVLEGMADEAFAALGDRPRYMRDGVDRLQAHLRQFPQYREVVIGRSELRVVSETVERATPVQWALREELCALIPDVEVILRVHRLSWTVHPDAPGLFQHGALAVCRTGPFTLRREFLVTSTS